MVDEDTPRWVDTLIRAGASAVPLVGGPLEVLLSDVRERRAAKVRALVSDIERMAGEESFLQRVSSDPRLEGLFVDAVEAAVRTSIEAKRKLLARAVADASVDPTDIDHSELVVGALRELDVQHVHALAALASEWDRMQQETGVTLGTSQVWPTLPEPIRAVLVRTATGKSAPQMLTAQQAPWRANGITDFGLEVLAALRLEGMNN